MKNTILSSIFIIVSMFSKAQVSVYDCSVLNATVTQAEVVNGAYEFYRRCIDFNGSINYDFPANTNKKITAASEIHIAENFHAGPADANSQMWFNINKCIDLNDVLCFSHSDLNSVEALKKFEIGIQMPVAIEQRIQTFIASGDTTNGGINPYLVWQLSAEAVFTNQATGFTKKVDGFYYQNFERDTSNLDKNLWTWNMIPTTHHIRFRYSPEKTGIWDVQINFTLKDGTTGIFCPFEINVIPNTSDDGYVKVAANQHVLERNGDLFFPIGQNLKWPRDDAFIPGTSMNLGYNAGAYGVNKVSSYSHVEFEQKMNEFEANGGDYFRLVLNPSSLEIEFEDIGNYTDRLDHGWEIDNIIEQAEELDIYVDFTAMVQYSLDRQSIYSRFNWDWTDEYISAPYYPRTVGSFGYKDKFGLSNESPEDWYTDLGCKKFYKQKLRYLISRYGYSTHIALLELMAEINLTAMYYEPEYLNPPDSVLIRMNLVYSPYFETDTHPHNIYLWNKEMANYVKNELNHKEHLLGCDYGGLPRQEFDSICYNEDFDVIIFNRYSDLLGNKYKSFINEVNSFANCQMPVLFGEAGPLEEFQCDPHSSYRKEAWMLAFTGVAGFNMWDGDWTPEVWHYLNNVRTFIEDSPEVNALFMGNWEAEYENAGNAALSNNDPAILKETTFIRGTFVNELGNTVPLMVGAISNLTDNFYTNRPLPDDLANPSWCFKQKDSILQVHHNKQDLYAGSGGAIYFNGYTLADYTFDWYDENGVYQSQNGLGQQLIVPLPHPLSCVTSSCTPETSEIPYIVHRDPSGNKSALTHEGDTSSFNEKKLNHTLSHEDNYPLLIYPNPAQNKIQIECDDKTIVLYKLIDGKGLMIRSLNQQEIMNPLDVSNLEAGIFVILGLDDNNTVKYQKRWVKL